MKGIEIVETRIWDVESVRNVCIKNRLYSCGNNEDYESMMALVSAAPNPSLDDIYRVASDILSHSDDETIENVMFILANDAVKSFFDVSQIRGGETDE